MPDKDNSDRLTMDELATLPVTVDVVTAGRAFGLGKSTAYSHAKNGTFPCKVKRVGSRWVVLTADLRRALGVPA